MLPIRTLVKRIRFAVHDKDSITYDDNEIVDVLNEAMRFVRRTIAEYQPDLLSKEITGVFQAGENKVVLDKRPLELVTVMAGNEIKSQRKERNHSDKIYLNDKLIFGNPTPICAGYTVYTTYKEYRLREINTTLINEYPHEGTPQVYYKRGLYEIYFYPIPQVTTAYTIATIDDLDELTINDTSPLLTEFEDFVVEYTQQRLLLRNEYEIGQDAQVSANIYNQIISCMRTKPVGINTTGYWRNTKRYSKGRW